MSITDYGVERSSDTYYIVSEDFGDLNLFDFLRLDYDIQSVKRIMHCLLKAVQTAHENGVFHRDIKLSNVIVNNCNQARLVDWGHAEFYTPGKSYSVSVSTRPYKPPELLVDFENYNLSLDVWEIANVLACLVL